MQPLEQEIVGELKRKEAEFLYEVGKRKVPFAAEARLRHRKLAKRLTRHLREPRLMAVLTALVIGSCLIPISARTKQHWCPINHDVRMKAVHGRYRKSLDHDDAESYRASIETVRRDFEDLRAQHV